MPETGSGPEEAVRRATQRSLSKSKLVAFRQCPKRLWLELHRPDLAEVSAASEAIFRTGHRVGDLARQIYDPDGLGSLVDLKADGVPRALSRTVDLLRERRPIFEAGLSANGALAFYDVLLPDPEVANAWRLIEVKASGSVKNYQRDDVAIQSYIARHAGLSLSQVAVAHIDTSWTYPGGGNYSGLLRQVDLTSEAQSRSTEVEQWVQDAHAIARQDSPPEIEPGSHCSDPFECGFSGHCHQGRSVAEFPVSWLPRIQSKALRSFIESSDVRDMREVPVELLNDQQRRVWDCTTGATTFFDADGARTELQPHGLPALFLDFETIALAVPIWPGTRPFQQVPFQFSIHRLGREKGLHHREFLDLSGDDPSKSFAEALLSECGTNEPVFVYSAAFEGTRLRELGERLPQLRSGLDSIRSRLVDLYPVAQRRYYHPSQQGSWSIKKLLPAISGASAYKNLQGVADGGMAMQAYEEAIDPATAPERRDEIRRQLLNYCALDTMAMVKVWSFFTGTHIKI